MCYCSPRKRNHSKENMFGATAQITCGYLFGLVRLRKPTFTDSKWDQVDLFGHSVVVRGIMNLGGSKEECCSYISGPNTSKACPHSLKKILKLGKTKNKKHI